MSEPIQEILDGKSDDVVQMVAALRRIITTTFPTLVEEPKSGWKNITYKDEQGVVTAISPYTNHVSLHLYKGALLPDLDGILEGSGKALRHIKFHKPDDVDPEVVISMVREAMLLNQ